MTKAKNKTPYFIIVLLLAVIALLLIAVFFKDGKVQVFKNAPQIVKTEETLDAWKAKWNAELNSYCQSDVFSSVSPEFQRAVSLVLQRYSENENTKNSLMIIRANQSCLDIQYANSVDEMAGADGVFLFSKKNSSPKGLKVLVNPEYKVQDDVTTALLLSHELTHAEQFILQDVSNRVIQECNNEASESFCNELQSMNGLGFYIEDSPEACVRHEGQAYLNENVFYSTLKKVEQDNILLRANNVIPSQANLPVYGFAVKFRELERQCPLKTSEDVSNFSDCLSNVYVRSEPFYQKECSL